MNPQKSFFSYIILLWAVATYTNPATAQPLAQNKSITDQLSDHFAIQHQLSEVPEDIRLQFEQNPLQLSAEKNERMLQLFDEAYDTDLLLEDFKSAIAQKVTGQYQTDIAQWLDAENTQFFTDTRQEFYTLQGKRKRVITMYEMDQQPVSPERTELIETLTDTTSVTESTVESSVIILRSVITALSQLSEQQTFTDSQINAIANNFRSQIEAQINQDLNSQMLVLFHKMEHDKLENYISFWGTEAGRWLNKAINESIQAAFKAGSERLLQSVKTIQ